MSTADVLKKMSKELFAPERGDLISNYDLLISLNVN